MTNFEDYKNIYDCVDKMTGQQLRGYWYRFIKDDLIFDEYIPNILCYAGGCSVTPHSGDEIGDCRAGDDGLVSTTCERYWEVSDILKTLVFADMIVREAVEHD